MIGMFRQEMKGLLVDRRLSTPAGQRLADAAIGGRRVMIWLQVRRLFCDEPGCKKRTLAEQVPGLTVRYGRKTALLAGMLQAIAVALAGRAGCRLAWGAAGHGEPVDLAAAGHGHPGSGSIHSAGARGRLRG
jgi:hypothetical protein